MCAAFFFFGKVDDFVFFRRVTRVRVFLSTGKPLCCDRVFAGGQSGQLPNRTEITFTIQERLPRNQGDSRLLPLCNWLLATCKTVCQSRSACVETSFPKARIEKNHGKSVQEDKRQPVSWKVGNQQIKSNSNFEYVAVHTLRELREERGLLLQRGKLQMGFVNLHHAT